MGNEPRQGYIALDHWCVTNLESWPRVADGQPLSVSGRVFLEYPRDPRMGAFLVHQPGRDVRPLSTERTKAINPKVQVGVLAHHASRHHEPLLQLRILTIARLVHVSDYLKPSPYNNCAGPRLAAVHPQRPIDNLSRYDP